MWSKTCPGDDVPGSQDNIDRVSRQHGQEQCHQALEFCHGRSEESWGQEAVSWSWEWICQPHQHPDAADDAAQDVAPARHHRLHPGVLQEYPAPGLPRDQVEGGH